MTRPLKKSQRKQDSNPGYSATEADALTTRRYTDRRVDTRLSIVNSLVWLDGRRRLATLGSSALQADVLSPSLARRANSKFVVSALLQCHASNCCEAGLSSSSPAGSRSGIGVWCWMLASWGCVRSSSTSSAVSAWSQDDYNCKTLTHTPTKLGQQQEYIIWLQQCMSTIADNLTLITRLIT